MEVKLLEYRRGMIFWMLLLKGFKIISSKGTSRSVALLAPYNEQTSKKSYRADILRALLPFPPEQKKQALEHAFFLSKGLENGATLVSAVLKFLPGVPEASWKELIQVSKSTFNAELEKDFDIILPALVIIPFDQKPATITIIKDFLKLEKSISSSALYAADFLPPDKRLAALEELCANYPSILAPDHLPYDLPRKILAHFIREEKIRHESYVHIQNQLDNRITDKDFAFQLATSIIHLAPTLQLQEDHPLFQKAIKVLSITDSDASNPKNPYVLHLKLKEITDKEPLLPCSQTESITMPTDENKQEQFAVALNLKGFRKRAQNKGFTFGDLPPGIDVNGFEKLFAAIKSRLESLGKTNEKQKQELEDEIYRLCDSTSLSALEKDTLSFDKAIPRLMKLTGDKKERVPNSAFYLYHILRAIYAESNQCQANELLSPQELRLLKFLSMVKACDIGQKDGIALYYNHTIPDAVTSSSGGQCRGKS